MEELLNEQFECEICGYSFDTEEEREPGICGDCADEQDSFNRCDGKVI